MALQIILSIVVIGVVAAIGLIFIDYRLLISVIFPYYGFSTTILNIVVIDRKISKIREEAASIQEDFDCDVLKIPWNDIKADWPKYEEIKGHVDKIIKSKKDFGKHSLTMWYLNDAFKKGNKKLLDDFDDLPLPIGRLISQRINCWWDHSLGKEFITFVLLITCISIAILVIYLIDSNMGLSEFCKSFLFPALPAIVLNIKYIQDHLKSNKKLSRLEKKADVIWDNVLSSQKIDIDITSRQLQDEIFDSRKTRQLIPDWYYRRLRIPYEAKSFYSVEQMVKDYKDSIK